MDWLSQWLTIHDKTTFAENRFCNLNQLSCILCFRFAVKSSGHVPTLFLSNESSTQLCKLSLTKQVLMHLNENNKFGCIMMHLSSQHSSIFQQIHKESGSMQTNTDTVQGPFLLVHMMFVWFLQNLVQS